VTREPNFDELIGAETSAEERQRLQHVHDLLVQAGPPAELTPKLQKAPTFPETSSGVTRLRPKPSRTRQVLVLLAAAVAVAAVFGAGYGLGNRGGKTTLLPVKRTINLRGTSIEPRARATLAVWHSRDGNWPMTLNVVGLPKLAAHSYYEVYLFRDGKPQPWGSCGTFRVKSPSRVVSVTLNAPYLLEKGDSWVVTRTQPGQTTPGKMVLRPVRA
jgi:hypothetical protein